jgi:hypothetical protein
MAERTGIRTRLRRFLAGGFPPVLDVPDQPAKPLVREPFIQVDRKDIIQRVLEKQVDPAQRVLAADVIRYMVALRQVESAKLLDDLIQSYDAFNPDDETVNLTVMSPPERRRALDELREKIADLARSANYIEIDAERLKELLDTQEFGALPAEVDLEEYDFHLLFYRGQIKDNRYHRTWRTLWLLERPFEVDAFARLFLALKLKPRDLRVQHLMQDGLPERQARRRVKRIRQQEMLEGISENTLHLKIFRKIARSELRILFPNAKIKFSTLDTWMLWLGSGGSTVVAIVMALLKFVAAVALSIFFVLITLGGALGAIFRSVMNFFNTRNRYMMRLAKSLYFHNLGSNQSVLALLNDDAEEEDIKEAVLTYIFLLKHGHRGIEDVRFEVEKFLKDEFDVELKFDIEDGCDHLRKLRLLVTHDTGAEHILEFEAARARLLEDWQNAPAQEYTSALAA